jgi:DNA modification methylase
MHIHVISHHSLNGTSIQVSSSSLHIKDFIFFMIDYTQGLLLAGRNSDWVEPWWREMARILKEDRRFIVLKSAELRETELGRTVQGMLTLSLMVIITEPWGMRLLLFHCSD